MLGTLAALSGLVQLGTGIWQAFKSEDLSKETRPEYKTPVEAQQALNIAKQQAYGAMPGYQQAKGNIEQQQETQASKMLNVADSGTDVLGAMSGLNLATNRANAGLDVQNEAYKSAGLSRLQSSLMGMAQYKDKEFDLNQMQPYQSSQQASSVLGEGAIQNLAGGFNTGVQNYMGYKTTQDMMDRIYGDGSGGGYVNNGGNRNSSGGGTGNGGGYMSGGNVSANGMNTGSLDQNDWGNYVNSLMPGQGSPYSASWIMPQQRNYKLDPVYNGIFN